MGTIDIILMALILIGAVTGFMKGFIKQFGALLGLIIGLIAANRLYHVVAEKIAPLLGDSLSLSQAISFVLIWLAVPLLFAIITSLITKALDSASLGGVNRLLGALLGMTKIVLVCCLLIGVLDFVDKDNKLIPKSAKSKSVLYYPMKNLTGIFLPAAKEITQQYII